MHGRKLLLHWSACEQLVAAGNVIRTEVTTILMPSWATRVAIEKARVRHLSPRGHLDGIVVNPFASSYLVGRLKWVDSLAGLNSSSSFMFIVPCTDLRIRFHGTIDLEQYAPTSMLLYACTGTVAARELYM